jgi:hypothetical protein
MSSQCPERKGGSEWNDTDTLSISFKSGREGKNFSHNNNTSKELGV